MKNIIFFITFFLLISSYGCSRSSQNGDINIVKDSGAYFIGNGEISKIGSGSFEKKSKVISRTTFWDNLEIMAHTGYFFPNIQFKVPEGYDFYCCGDTDTFSMHFITANGITRNIINAQYLHQNNIPYIQINSQGLHINMGGSIENPALISGEEYAKRSSLSEIPGKQGIRIFKNQRDDEYLILSDSGTLTIYLSSNTGEIVRLKDFFIESIQVDN